MSPLLQSIFAPSRRDPSDIRKINELRSQYAHFTDEQLLNHFSETEELLQCLAITAVVAERAIGQSMYDVQLRGALALARGSIAEMQTGEGKTLASVPAIAWLARQKSGALSAQKKNRQVSAERSPCEKLETHPKRGVHVITANDYLARRDANWMGDVYRRLGLSCSYIQQGMKSPERRAAYASDITFATAHEIGFDYLRDQLALDLSEQVHRPFHAAVIDEADSILIDEARIPLVIAGGNADEGGVAAFADQLVRRLSPGVHYIVVNSGRNVGLTDRGVRAVEYATGCQNLYDERNLQLFSCIQDALHAHALLHRDIDYVVKNGVIEMIDECKGRTAQDRRWPAGLHTAVEAKESVAPRLQGTILGSITLQNLMGLYPSICGMTGTALSSELEFKITYQLSVEVIPTNRPMIRVDHPDVVFSTKCEKHNAVVEEIRSIHCKGRPVLVGTASVAESEQLGRLLADIPHHVLNARNNEQEAAIVAQAGQFGAVTISTNMAGRGTDIELGEGVAALGGLYVIGTNKHESRRIDMQLRGRAGRQGDPGSSRFFVSLEDDLMTRYGDLNPRYAQDPDNLQRLVEGQNLDLRIFLHKYEIPIEGQRNRIQSYRQRVLDGSSACPSELVRLITLRTIDDLWADYLARVAEFRSGVQWLSLGFQNLSP